MAFRKHFAYANFSCHRVAVCLLVFLLLSENTHILIIYPPCTQCVVYLSSVMLNGHESTLLIEENRMKTECVTVADLLGADCVIGNDATKDRFLQELSGATILHIGRLHLC